MLNELRMNKTYRLVQFIWDHMPEAKMKLTYVIRKKAGTDK